MKFNSRTDLINNIKEISSQKEKFKIININGDFLSGKTSSIQKIISDIEFINQYNVYSYINDWEKYNYLFDITSDFFENSNLQHPEFLSNESKYFVSSFFDTLASLNISHKELFKEINELLLIESNIKLNDSLKESIETNIKNDLKKNLILNYFEISIECLIADLLNNFFPLNNQINSISEYLLSREPIRILLIFDDAQNISNKVMEWFKLFFNYMTSKKLGDMILYDYKGKDTEIYFGEFFNIDLIYISRNKSLKINGNDIVSIDLQLEYISENEMFENYKELIPEKDLTKLPIMGIPALADFYTQIEDDNENSTVFYAVNSLLKYIPPEYQRVIIFSSVFDCFNIKDLNLFEEINLDENEFDSIVLISDFIINDENGFRLEKNAKELLYAVFEVVFSDFNKDDLLSISKTMNQEYNHLDYSEFELLRELAYFNCFDKIYLAENYLMDKNSLNQLIDRRSDYFEKDKTFVSIKEKYAKQLITYNEIRDKNNYEDKRKSITKFFDGYKEEIEKRNKILQEDVVSVGSEIKEYTNEKELLEKEADRKGQISISLKNEIREIENDLKPFTHQNSKWKKTTNFVALVFSVAIIFNSDRIAEFIFGDSSNFDLIIIITLILLILLYGNGLLRYFRLKFKSEELHILKQNKSNKEKEFEKLTTELEILNADKRAKESKIDDLKNHIERMNKQIYENKKKLEKSFID